MNNLDDCYNKKCAANCNGKCKLPYCRCETRKYDPKLKQIFMERMKEEYRINPKELKRLLKCQKGSSDNFYVD